MADFKLNPAQTRLTRELYEAELRRVKEVQPMRLHQLAVDRYKKDLIKVLKKISPAVRYYP